MMKNRKLKLLGVCLFVAAPLNAHHSTAVNFNRDVIVTVDGIVTEYRFQNPHVQILMEVSKDDGAVETWMVELAAKNQLLRGGWTGEEFVPGQRLSVDGWKGYRDRTAYYQVATLEDGTEVRPPGLVTGREAGPAGRSP
jgi:hypothetical protein